jgi:hypothetical protein
MTAGEVAEPDYVVDMVGRLWPGTAVTPRTRPAPFRTTGGDRELVVLPSLARPRLLVPRDKIVAAAALAGFKTSASPAARRRMVLAARLVRAGALRLAPSAVRLTRRGSGDAQGIDEHISQALGTDVSISIHIGPPRAVRKPVLQLISPTGRTLGFAKVGTTELTRALVEAEATRLVELDRDRLHCVRVPEVLHHGTWQGLAVLAQSALVPIGASLVSPELLRSAMLEVAQVADVTAVRVSEHPYLDQLRRRCARLPPSSDATALAEAARETAIDPCGVVLRFGSWHGDWTPWNMAGSDDEVMVWDWEHFESGVPLGYDVLHHHVVAGVRDGLSPEAAFERAWSTAPALLADFQDGPREARLVAQMYVIDIAARYLRDGEEAGGTRLGNVGNWLVPVLRAGRDRLAGTGAS